MKFKNYCVKLSSKDGDYMTQSERTYLEEKLFLQTNLDTKLRSTIKNVYEQYKSTCDIFPDMHEAKFGMLYCRMILENDTNEMPHYKSIIFYTKESQTSYYMYRKQVLNYISKVLKKENAVAE